MEKFIVTGVIGIFGGLLGYYLAGDFGLVIGLLAFKWGSEKILFP